LYTLDLPYLWWQRYAAPVLVLVLGILLLTSPINVPWRLALVGLLLVVGIFLWRAQLMGRPRRLVLGANGQLRCRQANGVGADVSEVLIGVAHPRLLSARLTLANGRRCDLWVPGSALSAGDHRILRASLLGFRRPEQPDSVACD